MKDNEIIAKGHRLPQSLPPRITEVEIETFDRTYEWDDGHLGVSFHDDMVHVSRLEPGGIGRNTFIPLHRIERVVVVEEGVRLE